MNGSLLYRKPEIISTVLNDMKIYNFFDLPSLFSFNVVNLILRIIFVLKNDS